MLGGPGPALGPTRLMGPMGTGLRGGLRSPLYQRIRQCTVRSQSGSNVSNCEMPPKWDLSCQNPLGHLSLGGSLARARWIRRPCKIQSIWSYSFHLYTTWLHVPRSSTTSHWHTAGNVSHPDFTFSVNLLPVNMENYFHPHVITAKSYLASAYHLGNKTSISSTVANIPIITVSRSRNQSTRWPAFQSVAIYALRFALPRHSVFEVTDFAPTITKRFLSQRSLNMT